MPPTSSTLTCFVTNNCTATRQKQNKLTCGLDKAHITGGLLEKTRLHFSGRIFSWEACRRRFSWVVIDLLGRFVCVKIIYYCMWHELEWGNLMPSFLLNCQSSIHFGKAFFGIHGLYLITMVYKKKRIGNQQQLISIFFLMLLNSLDS